MTQELHYISATDALKRFRSRELSPVELMESVIRRAEAVEADVNAFTDTYFDQALAAAKLAEVRYGGGGEAPRLLEGLAVAVKAEEAITGQPSTQGSLLLEDGVADQTSVFAQRHLDAGAIVHARTTLPEFACAGFTHTKLYGVTRNPYNLELSVGGSSGGSGASLAAGTSTLASGSDIGGSIRIPAAATGVVGFKPPYGRVPCELPYNLDTYCHCGPMARTVADCALYENVVAGHDHTDIVSLREQLVLPNEFESVRGMRIALSVDLGDWPVADDVRANTLAAAQALREAGATVDEVNLQLPREKVMRAAWIHFWNGFAGDIYSKIKGDERVNDYVLNFIECAREAAAGYTVAQGLALEADLFLPVGELFEHYDALLLPTTTRSSLKAGDGYLVDPKLAADDPGNANLAMFMTIPFNIMSRCPVLAVPSGVGEQNAPTGVQIVGRTYDDLTPFRAGAALEQVRPWDRWPQTIGQAS
jgi:Asp-tRNA(Asn)/Glu-tRNA(Gln) amidotransferase A subunit family amidase